MHKFNINFTFTFTQVNTNGIISFNQTNTAYTPTDLPVNTNILAVYWADVDTTGVGIIFYRETTNSALLSRASIEIQNAFSIEFFATHLIIATWNSTGYYNSRTDKVYLYVCVETTYIVQKNNKNYDLKSSRDQSLQ